MIRRTLFRIQLIALAAVLLPVYFVLAAGTVAYESAKAAWGVVVEGAWEVRADMREVRQSVGLALRLGRKTTKEDRR